MGYTAVLWGRGWDYREAIGEGSRTMGKGLGLWNGAMRKCSSAMGKGMVLWGAMGKTAVLWGRGWD